VFVDLGTTMKAKMQEKLLMWRQLSKQCKEIEMQLELHLQPAKIPRRGQEQASY
jgi:hypothetical protein